MAVLVKNTLEMMLKTLLTTKCMLKKVFYIIGSTLVDLTPIQLSHCGLLDLHRLVFSFWKVSDFG